MSDDISGFGLEVSVKASVTFPAGFAVSAFADDADPFDMPDQDIAEASSGLNGNLITWSKAKPNEVMIAVVPGSDDDRNFAVIYDANKPGPGKFPVGDVITITAVYPDGTLVSLAQGRMLSGPPGKSVASAGRMKTNKYKFVFETVTRT